MPALLTRISSPPKAATVALTAAWTSRLEVTSQATARAAVPSSTAVRAAPRSSMSAIITCAPRATNKLAMARPRPWAPPVTSARRPCRSEAMTDSPLLLCNRAGYDWLSDEPEALQHAQELAMAERLAARREADGARGAVEQMIGGVRL